MRNKSKMLIVMIVALLCVVLTVTLVSCGGKDGSKGNSKLAGAFDEFNAAIEDGDEVEIHDEVTISDVTINIKGMMDLISVGSVTIVSDRIISKDGVELKLLVKDIEDFKFDDSISGILGSVLKDVDFSKLSGVELEISLNYNAKATGDEVALTGVFNGKHLKPAFGGGDDFEDADGNSNPERVPFFNLTASQLNDEAELVEHILGLLDNPLTGAKLNKNGDKFSVDFTNILALIDFALDKFDTVTLADGKVLEIGKIVKGIFGTTDFEDLIYEVLEFEDIAIDKSTVDEGEIAVTTKVLDEAIKLSEEHVAGVFDQLTTVLDALGVDLGSFGGIISSLKNIISGELTVSLSVEIDSTYTY